MGELISGPAEYKPAYLQLFLQIILLLHHNSRLFLADHGSGLTRLPLQLILFLHKCILYAQQCFLVVAKTATIKNDMQ